MLDLTHQRFVRLLQVLKPDAVMMMEAYFDESGTHDSSPVMCVAGYLFSAEQAARLDLEWADVLDRYKLSHFHAADCAHGVGEFKNLDRKQRNDVVVALVGIIKRRMQLGIAVSVSETNFGQVDPPTWLRAGPYVLV